ncbi:MAG: hypothetical protein OEZ34_07675, partial [Spirochaetia bacterium]|nr:hypothetical protein [Spirochaetia bacterium]
MKYDKIRGESAAECMMKVRSRYGSSAIILQTREMKEGGLLGMMAKTVYEVHFMVEESGESRKPNRKSDLSKIGSPKTNPEPDKETALKSDPFSKDEISETFTRLQKKRDRLSALIQEKSEVLKQDDLSVFNPDHPPAKTGELKTGLTDGNGSEKTISHEKNLEVNASPLAMDEIPDESISISGEEIQALMKKWDHPDQIRHEFSSQESEGRAAESLSLDRGERNIHKIRNLLLGAQLSREFTETLLKDLDHELSRKERSEYKLIEGKMISRLSEMIHT